MRKKSINKNLKNIGSRVPEEKTIESTNLVRVIKSKFSEYGDGYAQTSSSKPNVLGDGTTTLDPDSHGRKDLKQDQTARNELYEKEEKSP